ncbi:MAG: aminotransferase, partial [Actinomycetaceae bacterium UMB1218B]|nr:aminotransferase [Actinomycetaceae bacterium UMB1218B]
MTTTDEDFSRHLSRWGTHSAKWDLLAKDLGENAIALSVADMEFVSCPEVREAIADAAALGAYGYTEVFDDFAEAATAWMTRRHGWSCEVEDVHFFPRVVQCVAALV